MTAVPWDRSVVEKDQFLFDLNGLCAGCQQPVGSAHGDSALGLCRRLRSRLRARHLWISWLHAKGKHEATEPAIASKCLEQRDILIDQLRSAGDYNRALIQELLPDVAQSIDESERHRAQYRHLDADWDGTGWPPSALMVIRDCMEGNV